MISRNSSSLSPRRRILLVDDNANGLAARKSVLESAEFKALAPEAQFAKQIDYVHFPPQAPGIGDALAMVDQALNNAILGKADPAKALSAAAGQATKIVQDNQKKYGS